MNAAQFIAFADAFFGLTELQKERFTALDSIYRDWNGRINVISRKDIDSLYSHHVLHSLAIARYLQTLPGELEHFAGGSILDLGTGGGFPGVPLAILFPGARFTLCDSVGKKTIVASAAVSALGLENAVVVNSRAENLPGPYDYVVSRAVASLEDLYPWVKGKFSRGILCLKGGDVNEEIAAAMGRFRLRKGSVHSWRLSEWLDDTYFAEKLLIHLEK